MERLSKRIDRYYSMVEYYKFSEPHRLISCCLRGEMMSSELMVLASQPIDEHRLSFNERVQQMADNKK